MQIKRHSFSSWTFLAFHLTQMSQFKPLMARDESTKDLLCCYNLISVNVVVNLSHGHYPIVDTPSGSCGDYQWGQQTQEFYLFNFLVWDQHLVTYANLLLSAELKMKVFDMIICHQRQLPHFYEVQGLSMKLSLF